MTPTIRPKPQLSQQARAETNVTSAIAPAGVFGSVAMALMPRFTTGAAASVEPQTRTKAICIEKASSPHTPLPQCSITSMGLWWQMGIAKITASIVKMMAKINGSGRYR